MYYFYTCKCNTKNGSKYVAGVWNHGAKRFCYHIRKGKMATGYRHNIVANLCSLYGVGGCLFIFPFPLTLSSVNQPNEH